MRDDGNNKLLLGSERNMTFFRSVCSAVFLVVVVLIGAHSNACAEFYKYKDSSGSLVITNKLEDVPKKYRKKVKVVWDEELAAKDPHARRMAAAESQRQENERKQAQQKEKKPAAGTLQATDGKMLVISIDEETGQVIRRFE
jgi:hypothetical protein